MLGRSLRHLSTAAWRTSPRYVVVLLACVLLALAWYGPPGRHGPLDAGMKHSLRNGAAASAATDSQLDSLRKQAANGDERSNLELSSALMDRYDQTGDSNDLFEALEWVDRRWDVSDHVELVGRVVAQYCSHRVVQWHRLCGLGE